MALSATIRARPRLLQAIRSAAATPTTCGILDSHAAPDWDCYVERHPQGALFHTTAWKTAVERAFGHRALYLTALRGDKIVGVLPAFVIDSLLGGRMLVSVPYGVYGGVLADDYRVRARLLEEAERAARQLDVNRIDLRSFGSGVAGGPQREPKMQAANWILNPCWHRVEGYATFRRELPARPEDVADWLPRKARAAARRAAETPQIETTFDDAGLKTVWRLYCRSMRRLGSVNYPYAFFESLAALTPQRHLVQVVSIAGRPVAGLVTFIYKDAAMAYFVGVDERRKIYGLNNLLYLNAMERAAALGLRIFDFGRSRTDNLGSVNFKRFHGFEPQPLAYLRYVPAGATVRDLTPSNPRFAAARRVWSHLPLGVTRPLGAWLARSIPG